MFCVKIETLSYQLFFFFFLSTMAGLSRKQKAGTGRNQRPNKRKLVPPNNPRCNKLQKKLAENLPAMATAAASASTPASSPASTDAATISSSPSLEDVGMPSCSSSPAECTPNARSSKRNPRPPDISPYFAKSSRNKANFIQFVLSSEKEYHDIVDELSMKGFENLTGKMSSTMPHIRACNVGDKIVVEVQLLGTSAEEQEQSETCMAAATAPPRAATAPPRAATAPPHVVDDSLRFNNRQVNFESTLESKLNYESFDMNKRGKGRNADAVRQAQSRARSKIVNAIKLAGHTKEQQALALHLALLHEDVQEIAKTAGFKNDTSKIIAYQWEQMKEIIQDATKNKGTSNANKEQFMNTIFTAVAPNAHEAPDGKIVAHPNAPSMRGCAKALGLDRSRVTRQITKGMKKRRERRANSQHW
jgi:hypothetical protein